MSINLRYQVISFSSQHASLLVMNSSVGDELNQVKKQLLW